MEKTFIKKGRVTVIGLTGQSAFLSTERFPEPGETVSCKKLFFEPGGKGHNQAVACARTGVETVFIGAVGCDANGEICQAALMQEGIKPFLIKKDVPTAFAVITTDADGENMVKVFGGAAKELKAQDLKNETIQECIRNCDYLLLQNELSIECLRTAIDLATTADVPVILNPAPAQNLDLSLLSKCRIITPNYGEAKQLAGFGEKEAPSQDALVEFFRESQIENTIITMGERGVLLITDSLCEIIPAFSVGTVVDTTGAGDTFNGTLAGMLAHGISLEQAVKISVKAAGISVTRPGAVGSIPAMDEINGN